MTNQKIVDQVVAEGRALNVMFEESQPRQNYYGFLGGKKCSNVQSLETNLMSKFSADSNKDVPSKIIECKRGRGRPKKL